MQQETIEGTGGNDEVCTEMDPVEIRVFRMGSAASHGTKWVTENALDK